MNGRRSSSRPPSGHSMGACFPLWHCQLRWNDHLCMATRRNPMAQMRRALEGFVRLHALIRVHAVRKQAAMILYCRLLARVSARGARMAIEGGQPKTPQPHQACTRETEVTPFLSLPRLLCLSVSVSVSLALLDCALRRTGCATLWGFVEELQAKLLRRKAAVKREKAMTYAMSHQVMVRSFLRRWK